jgi:hypothetical protein
VGLALLLRFRRPGSRTERQLAQCDLVPQAPSPLRLSQMPAGVAFAYEVHLASQAPKCGARDAKGRTDCIDEERKLEGPTSSCFGANLADVSVSLPGGIIWQNRGGLLEFSRLYFCLSETILEAHGRDQGRLSRRRAGSALTPFRYSGGLYYPAHFHCVDSKRYSTSCARPDAGRAGRSGSQTQNNHWSEHGAISSRSLRRFSRRKSARHRSAAGFCRRLG